ncbi:MAG: formylmethanofuran dehydrogenase subunit C [Candidatus Hodarchaeales archaeon]|jgi:formylmethanofuran dehydrogenase subunit C
MTELTFKLKSVPRFPLDVENLNPAKVVKTGLDKLDKLEIYEGNRVRQCGDLFQISGTIAGMSEEQVVIFDNSCDKLRKIGQKMNTGTIIVNGDAGSHVGEYMSGGEIIVKGNVGAYSGLELKGGHLLIEGDAGEFLGGAYWGSWTGMTGGKIIVKGNTGNEVGSWMKGGKIEINGRAGDFIGVHMGSKKALIVAGSAGPRAGGQMTSGKIVVHDPAYVPIPSFKRVEEVKQVKISEEEVLEGSFIHFIGDYSERKKPAGNLFVKV